ncbi:MAG: FtsX-like permease family protein [Chloroflexota bacterium]|nr:FtsX-like permease family protein [Chloroflexota bacterium]
MNDLFGLSMTYIMIALLVIVTIAASTVGWVVLRNRVMFFIGVRNIPRRRAQTVLIVIGLMLSTLIVSTAFSIGDTVNYSITNEVYSRLHSIDEIVQADTGKNADNPFEAASVVSARPITQADANKMTAAFNRLPDVDGAVPVIRAPVPVSDAQSGQSEPLVVLLGVDAGLLHGFESDIETVGGSEAKVENLAPDELYANQSAADKLAIQKGDTLRIFIAQVPHEYVVKDIVKDRVLTGAAAGVKQGLVMGLPEAQKLLGRPNEVDFIAISNLGDVHSGIDGSETVTALVNQVLRGSLWRATPVKQDFVDAANRTSSFFTTFFVVLGLFSIAAGMLLIFLIFVMLSAERKMEMGMLRAVGTRRSHLVQIFMSEGMAYNTLAAAVGCVLGIAVSLIMVRIMAALFAGEDLSIAFHVTPRSLIVSYSLGVALTFLTVTFSSWRIGSLNIVSAIRDTPDPPPVDTRPQWRGGILGAASFVRWLFVKPTTWRQWGIAVLLLLAAVAQILITVGLFVAAFALYGGTPLASVLAVLVGVAGVLLAMTSIVSLGIALNRTFQSGALAVILGIVLIIVGLLSNRGAPYALGISLVVLGASVTLVMLKFQQRLIFTAMGFVLLIYWLLGAGGKIPPHLRAGIEMFFLSGITMVLAATFVLVYNADLMLAVLTRAGNVFPTLVPSIRTAVAYPLANKFRTGMTVAMISLVMFALVMISTMNSNFSRIFLSDDALGGYDVVISESPTNPIPDVKAALARQGVDTGPITQVDDVRHANSRIAEVRNKPALGETGEDFARYNISGLTRGFIEHNGVVFQARAEGLNSDADVWHALQTNPNAAIVDAFAIGGGGGPGGGEFSVNGIKNKDRTFKPVELEVRDSSDPSKTRTVEVVGVIATRASLIYAGLYLAPPAFDSVFAKPESTSHLLKLQSGIDADAEAKAIEKALQSQGVQADSLRKLIDDARAQNQGFTYLIQGFMGIGLFVGIAAVGVIAFRTVVERRQQIGMLRAIGYTRRAIALSFIMESSFITLLGVLSGILLGLLLAYQLTRTDDFAAGGVSSFYIPWLQIIGIGAFAFVASFIMTIIPSRQASSIPIAEALRYE